MAVISGEHLTKCAICGAQEFRSKLRRDYRNYLVCKSHQVTNNIPRSNHITEVRPKLTRGPRDPVFMGNIGHTWDTITEYWEDIDDNWENV